MQHVFVLSMKDSR